MPGTDTSTPLRVLLLEDDPQAARAISALIEAEGGGRFTVAVHGSVPEAARDVRANGADAVLVCLSFEGREGIGGFAAAYAALPGLPIIVYTESEQEALAIRAVQAGAREYILKDQFYGTLFRRVVRHAVEQAGAEREIREREATYMSLFNSLSEGVLILDPEGRVLDMNASVERNYGYTRGEVVGRTFEFLLEPSRSDLGELRDSFSRVLSEGTQRLELWGRTRDGGIQPVDVTLSAGRFEGQPAVIAVARDISARLAADEALRIRTAELEQLFEEMPEAVALLDPEYRVVKVNRTFTELFGYTYQDAAGENLDILLDCERGRSSFALITDAVRSGRTIHVETVRRRKDGTEVEVSVLATPIDIGRGTRFYYGIYRDITERKRGEQLLAESRDYYHSMLDRLPAMVWRTNTAGGVDFMNETWLAFTGKSLEDELGSRWLGSVHPADHQRVVDASRAAIRELRRFELEYRLRNEQGEYRWIHVVGQPFYDSAGTYRGYIGAAFDMTRTKTLEESFQQAQKMEAVGRLAGGIAHDFNNLLSVVVGSSGMAKMLLEPGDPVLEEIAEIDHAAERATALTQQLLAFSRRQMLQPEPVSVNALVRDSEKMLRRLIGTHIRIGVEARATADVIEADPTQLHQVLMNLAVNARDAMPEGGDLIFRTDVVELGDRDATDLPPGRYVRLAVCDTGVGIPEGLQEQIFEPFFTTKDKSKGTGLGLATVYGIVRQLGGSVSVRSSEGRGAAFELRFPLIPEEREATESRREAPEVDPVGGTVLVVEDDDSVRRTFRRTLEANGFRVLEASNGNDALAQVRSLEGAVDLVLTDLIMPEMNGITLVERLRRDYPEMQVVYLSGYTDDMLPPQESRGAGPGFIQKPVAPDSLVRLVRAALGRR